MIIGKIKIKIKIKMKIKEVHTKLKNMKRFEKILIVIKE